MRFCFLWIALLAIGFVQAQEFPRDFIGHWKGELLWYTTGKKEPQKVTMQLIIQPSDTAGQYTWQMVYGANQEDVRPYLLKPVDTARGHWMIDERDGIQLDQYWTGYRFSSAFTVQTTTIISSYWREGDQLLVEFHSLGAPSISKTGQGTKEVPFVESYAVKGFQKAVLKRVHQ